MQCYFKYMKSIKKWEFFDSFNVFWMKLEYLINQLTYRQSTLRAFKYYHSGSMWRWLAMDAPPLSHQLISLWCSFRQKIMPNNRFSPQTNVLAFSDKILDLPLNVQSDWLICWIVWDFFSKLNSVDYSYRGGSEAVADPGFPWGWGRQSSRGASASIRFATFSQKLHEIQRNWTPSGVRVPCVPLDPPLLGRGGRAPVFGKKNLQNNRFGAPLSGVGAPFLGNPGSATVLLYLPK